MITRFSRLGLAVATPAFALIQSASAQHGPAPIPSWDRHPAPPQAERAKPGDEPAPLAVVLGGDGLARGVSSTPEHKGVPIGPGARGAPLGLGQSLGERGSQAATIIASLSATGIPANLPVTEAAISSDGRSVAFVTAANNLGGVGPSSNLLNVYVADLDAHTVTLASRSLSGGGGNGSSFDVSISGNGQRVVFASDATDLVLGDFNANRDVFMYDRGGGGLTQVNVTVLGLPSPTGGSCENCQYDGAWPSISADGRYASFFTTRRLLPVDPDHPEFNQWYGSPGIYIKDLDSGVVECASMRDGLSGAPDSTGFAFGNSSVSSNGRFVAFAGTPGLDRTITGPVPGPSSGGYWVQAYVRDRSDGATVQVSRTPDGNHGNSGGGLFTDYRRDVSVSDDGHVAFTSSSYNLVPNDLNLSVRDIFYCDATASGMRRLNLTPSLRDSTGHARVPAITPNGRFVVYQSAASDLVTGYTPGTTAVYLRDVSRARTSAVTLSLLGQPAGGVDPSISGSGRYISFLSAPFAFTGEPGSTQAMVRDMTIAPEPSHLTVRVVDSDTGHPLDFAGAEIEDAGRVINLLGTSDGRYVLEEGPVGAVALRVWASTYHTRQSEVVLESGASKFVTVQLHAERPGDRPQVVEVYSRWAEPGTRTFFLHGADLMQTIHAKVDWKTGLPGSVQFITPVTTVQAAYVESTDTWDADMQMGTDFGPNGGLVVRAMNAAGLNSPEYRANFKVIELPSGLPAPSLGFLPSVVAQSLTYSTPNVSLSIPKAGVQAGSVPSSIPLFGGQEMTWGTGLSASGSFKGDGTASFAASLSAESAGAGVLEGAQLLGVQVTGSGGGTMNWTYDEAHDRWLIGGQVTVAFVAEVSVPIKPAPLPNPLGLPMFWQGKLSLGVGTTMGVKGIEADQSLAITASADLDPFPGVSATIGVGAAGVVSVSGTLGASGKLGFEFLNSASPRTTTVGIGLSASVGAQFGPFSVSQPVFSVSWSLTFPRPADLVTPDAPLSIRLVDRGYLAAPGGGNRFVAGHGQGSTRAGTPSPVETPIQLNVFNESSAAMLALGNDVLMVWQQDEPSRTPINRTRLVWSRYSAAGAAWSAPMPVADNATADLRPRLAAMPDGRVLCVWEDTKDVIAEPLNPNDPAQVAAKMEEFKAKSEIAAAVFDPVTGSWGPMQRLTNNLVFEHSPRVGVADDGVALVTWIANPAGNLLGSASEPNSVWSSWNPGAGWSAPVLVAAGIPSIITCDMSPRPDDSSSAMVVYSADTDGDPGTMSDIDLFTIEATGGKWAGPLPWTKNSIPDTSPSVCWDCWYSGWNILWAAMDDYGTSIFFGNGGSSDTLVQLPHAPIGALSFVRSLGPSFNHYIVWQDVSAVGPDLSYIGFDYDEGLWSFPRSLTSDDSLERPTSMCTTASGDILVAYNKTATGTETRIVDVGGQPRTIDVPTLGATDLYVLRHTVETDLAIDPESFSIDPPNPRPAELVTLKFRVRNLRDRAVWGSTYTIHLYDRNPALGGVLIDPNLKFGGTMEGGSEREVTQLLYWSASQQQLPLYVVLDPNHATADVDRSNNAFGKTFVRSPDLTVQSLTAYAIGPADWQVTVTVTNIGGAPCPASSVQLHAGGPTDPLLATLSVPALQAGSGFDATYYWAGLGSLGATGPAAISAVVDPQSLIAEFDEENNSFAGQVNVNVSPTAPCPTDLNIDGVTNTSDLVLLLLRFGQATPPGSPGASADLTGDGTVNTSDLVLLLLRFGQACA